MRPLSLDDLREAIAKIVGNARELVEESEILYRNKRYARAYTLAHLSAEEIVKIPMIVRAATDAYLGLDVDWRNLDMRLRDHKVKITSMIIISHLGNYLDGLIPEDVVDKMNEDLAHLKDYNDSKNLGLYVGFVDNQFVQPSEIIAPAHALQAIEQALSLLGYFAVWEQISKDSLEQKLSSPEFRASVLQEYDESSK